MKTVKNIEELRALAAARGASMQYGTEVFNAERKQFRLKQQVAKAEDTPKPAEQVPVTVVMQEPKTAPELVALASDMTRAVQDQAEANRMLADVLADRPTRWIFKIERDSSGAMESVTAVGESD